MLPPDTLEITETSSNSECPGGPTCTFASASSPAAPNNAARLPPPDMAIPISVSLGFIGWLQDAWPGFGGGRVWTGELTHPDSIDRTIPTAIRAVSPRDAATLAMKPFRFATHLQMCTSFSVLDEIMNEIPP